MKTIIDFSLSCAGMVAAVAFAAFSPMRGLTVSNKEARGIWGGTCQKSSTSGSLRCCTSDKSFRPFVVNTAKGWSTQKLTCGTGQKCGKKTYKGIAHTGCTGGS
jgi:hypothetical protein